MGSGLLVFGCIQRLPARCGGAFIVVGKGQASSKARQ